MTSKTTHQMTADHIRSAQNSVNRLSPWLASTRDFFTQLGAVGRGFVMLLVLLLFAIPALAILFPRSVTPASAPLEVFSGERAMVHLPIIASEPHPQGSPALARVRDYLVGQLTDMGLEASHFGIFWRRTAVGVAAQDVP